MNATFCNLAIHPRANGHGVERLDGAEAVEVDRHIFAAIRLNKKNGLKNNSGGSQELDDRSQSFLLSK